MVRAIFHSADGGSTDEIDVPDGWTLMEGARQEGIQGIVADCGGGAICGTCHVRVRPEWADRLPEPEPSEAALLTIVPEPCETSRLACQIPMEPELEGIEVDIPSTQLDI
ncbi:(2Fe-2S)-binding protein [Leucobacter sp. CSA1]|uniref:(2Fe-2S)-binding protein n=1 Tax=Leucobacter chromiisoli TaxID=2796471 RepID=A0A934UT88_9MICO|nr:2Fe-2S iron-sulfur cluster-binding protein [Leucobacter chromiisoli]MBK0417470.1 (2Fe-2S)-binding protein [Leucobacter chromiisoli]